MSGAAKAERIRSMQSEGNAQHCDATARPSNEKQGRAKAERLGEVETSPRPFSFAI